MLKEMDEYEFEHLVADIWNARGYRTTVTSESVDRGIDVVAVRDTPYRQKELIQAKRYMEKKVGSPEIQQYSSLKHQEEDVDAVIIVTTSSFSGQAEMVAKKLNVKLIDCDGLLEMINESNLHDIIRNYVSQPVQSESDNAHTQRDNTEEMIEPVYDRSMFLNSSEFNEISGKYGVVYTGDIKMPLERTVEFAFGDLKNPPSKLWAQYFHTEFIDKEEAANLVQKIEKSKRFKPDHVGSALQKMPEGTQVVIGREEILALYISTNQATTVVTILEEMGPSFWKRFLCNEWSSVGPIGLETTEYPEKYPTFGLMHKVEPREGIPTMIKAIWD